MFGRLDVLGFWRKAKISDSSLLEANHVADLVMKYKSVYDPIEQKLGVPFYVTGAIDYREESFNHHNYLGNGDPLYKPTTHVPKNRGPFPTWIDGAIDAFSLNGFNRLPKGGHWDVVTALIKCEGYNGMGYNHMGLRSPYVWAGTTMQQKGMYVSDGHFDPNAFDHRVGVAAIFLALKAKYNVNLNEA